MSNNAVTTTNFRTTLDVAELCSLSELAQVRTIGGDLRGCDQGVRGRLAQVGISQPFGTGVEVKLLIAERCAEIDGVRAAGRTTRWVSWLSA